MKDSRRFWNKMAKTYDREESGDRLVYERALSVARQYLSADQSALDLGCGTGTLTLDLAPDLRDIQGIDFSEAMIDEAVRKAEERSLENTRFLCGTLEDTGFDVATFDVVFSFYLLHLLEDLDGTLRAVHRTLKPGGYFISLTPCLGETAVVKHLLAAGGVLGLMPRTRKYRVDELIDQMKEIGFDIDRQEMIREKTHEVFLVARKKR